jgi:opacity protein-like surface antigen
MTGKFAAVPVIRVVLGLMFLMTIQIGLAAAQQTQAPAASSDQSASPQPPTQDQPAKDQQAQPQQPQTPANPQSGSEEANPQEIPVSQRRAKPPEFKKWNYNVAGGGGLYDGSTKLYVRGGGGIAAGGVARNYNKYVGLRLDVQWDNLPLNATALQQAQSPGGHSYVYSAMLNPIFSIPVSKLWSGYVLVGPSYFHRSGKLDSSNAQPGSICNGFFEWWGRCYAGSIPVNGDFLKASQNEFGYDVGAGVARKITPRIEIYAEVRYMHGTHLKVTTDMRPITLGIRW